MSCINSGNAIVRVSPWGRLKLGNRYVWVDFHEYCGPSFSWDSAGQKPYDPVGVDDPIWPLFGAWLDKYNAKKEKAAKARAAASIGPTP